MSLSRIGSCPHILESFSTQPSTLIWGSGWQHCPLTEVLTALHWHSMAILDKPSIFFSQGAVLCPTRLSGGRASSTGSFESKGIRVDKVVSKQCYEKFSGSKEHLIEKLLGERQWKWWWKKMQERKVTTVEMSLRGNDLLSGWNTSA